VKLGKASEEIGALIDHIEQIRDELLSIQNSMERMEAEKSDKPNESEEKQQ
jgi:hypothetical protein